MRLAVLGAGLLGSCLALEMAKRGVQVDLYDREGACVTQAGGRNEGKIHLGFVYGADPSFQTADKMIAGAMQFYPLLRRWVGSELDTIAVSDPFVYAIDRGSLLSVQQCEKYFLCLEKKIQEYGSSEYPGSFMQKVEKLSESQCNQLFNSDRILAAYRTPERSIDARKLASILQKKVPTVASFYPHSEIQSVTIRENEVQIGYAIGTKVHNKFYDVVVNALWDGRLALDAQVGLMDVAPWTYRLKHAIFLKSNAGSNIPSVTIIQGAYGDLVCFGHGNYYLSWYPVCKRGFATNGICPPDWNRNLSKREAEQMTVDALQNLSGYIPALGAINMKNIENLSVLGGVIYAHGKTDVMDPQSGLHNRYQPAIQSKGSYYSVNPGKYTLCPYFANQVADQICSARIPSPLFL